MENNEHVLLCIMGRTACGKDSLVNKLCELTGARQIISYTTRPRRDNEGETHIFVDDVQYQEMQESGIIAAFTQIGEYKYWTTIDQLADADIYIIDYEGLKTLRKLNLPNVRLVSIYINTPDEIRKERAIGQRGDDKIKFRARDLAEKTQFREMLKEADFDYAISNIDFAKAYSILKWVATVEGAWKNNQNGKEE
jgi:guanylate kinase